MLNHHRRCRRGFGRLLILEDLRRQGGVERWERKRESGKRAAVMRGPSGSLRCCALPARYRCQYLIPEDVDMSVSMPSSLISELSEAERTGS